MFQMTKKTGAIFAAMLVLSQGPGAVIAAAVPAAPGVVSSTTASVVPAQHRPHYYGHSRHRSGGVGVGAIIGGIIIGGLIAEAIREGRARDSDVDRCAARFRSFDPRSGTYVTYSGEVRICPYLR